MTKEKVHIFQTQITLNFFLPFESDSVSLQKLQRHLLWLRRQTPPHRRRATSGVERENHKMSEGTLHYSGASCRFASCKVFEVIKP